MTHDDPFVALAQRIRRIARSEASRVSGGNITRWRVTSTAPLRLVSLADPSDVLEDGEEDLDVAAGLTIAKNDVVAVHEDGDGDYILTSVVKP